MEDTQLPNQNQPLQNINPQINTNNPINSNTQVEPAFPPPQPVQPIQPPISPVPPKKSPFLGILLTFLFFVTLLTAGYFGYGYWKETNKPTPTPLSAEVSTKEETPTPDPMANWKAYTNEVLGLELKIPPTWLEETGENKNLIQLKASDGSYLQISFIQSDKNLSDYLAGEDDIAATAWEGQPSKEIIKTTEGKVANYESIQRQEKWLAADFITLVTYIKTDNRIYTVSIIPSSSNNALNSEVTKNYDQILTTFGILKWSDISKWKIWTDPDGFQFKYPSSIKVSRINLQTKVAFEYGNRQVVIAFSQITSKSKITSCSGDCSQNKEIQIKLGKDTLTATSIWPNTNNDYTFLIKQKYPGNTFDKFLAVVATYPEESRLYEINQILSTFEFVVEK